MAPGAVAQRSPNRAFQFRPLELLDRVQPEYTPEARLARLQGSVILYLEVSPAGTVDKARVIQSLGFGLDEKAIEAVKQWRFKPATVKGKPIKVQQSAEVRFLLNPVGAWRVARAAYRVARSSAGAASKLSKPILNQYTSPDDGPCLSSGGPVVVDIQISKLGKPSHLELIEEHGEAAGKAVIQVVPMWRFQPGLVDGKPREFTGTFEMDCRASVATGEGGSSGGGVFRVGGGVTAPVPIYRPEPDYSEEARRMKYQGTTILYVEVDTSGHATNMRVVRALGLGLDENAMEAVNQWRFKPGMKNGAPVTVAATVEVNFRLL
jgi:TonB family protein